ncbi:MAG: HypC/HybG/HupF family hydrogenase formation chaperone [Bacteroidota bacterium]
MCLAIPGRIKNITMSEELVRKAKVVFGSIIKDVYLDMIPQAKEGDYVLVHAGVAINLVNETEALRTLSYLKRYGGLEELLPQN